MLPVLLLLLKTNVFHTSANVLYFPEALLLLSQNGCWPHLSKHFSLTSLKMNFLLVIQSVIIRNFENVKPLL